MVLGFSSFDLIAGGCALIALVVAVAILAALGLRYRTSTRPPRFHVGLGVPIDQPIPERRPRDPQEMEDPAQEPPISDSPDDFAEQPDPHTRDSADPPLADARPDDASGETTDAPHTMFEEPLPAGAADDGREELYVADTQETAEDPWEAAATRGHSGAPDSQGTASLSHAHVEAELTELRLALEASQAELTHLTAARDHALSVVAEYEQQITEWRQQFDQRDSQHAQQHEALAVEIVDLRQHSAVLEAELEQTRARLETTAEDTVTPGAPTAASLGATEVQQLLGQYEATQASLQREKLDLETQLRDWQQKSEHFERELERAGHELSAAQASASTPSSGTDAAEQREAFQRTHQQVVADLSLANETVKQLHQQLMLRDTAFAQLKQEKQQVHRQLDELKAKLETLPAGSTSDNESAVEAPSAGDEECQAYLQRLQSLLDDRDRAYGELRKHASRVEQEKQIASLYSELKEQKDLVRALRGEQEGHRKAVENGQPVPRSVESAETHSRDAIRTRTDAQFGEVYDQRPEHVDDLQKIKGIGPVLEKRLNQIGIYRYAQMKEWTKSVVEHLDKQLSLRGRIVRDRWVQQARKLCT